METIFNQFDGAGRIIRLRQGFENLDDKDAPEIGYVIAVFGMPRLHRGQSTILHCWCPYYGCASCRYHCTDVRDWH